LSVEKHFLIVGLGNPGRRYSKTRHNIGFMIVEAFAKVLSLQFRPGEGEFIVAEGTYANAAVSLLKPLTYMNLSGRAVAQAMAYYKLPLSDLLIVVDDIHLPLGAIRLRKKGSDGGHKGLASIIHHVNSKEFPRLRFGVKGETEIQNWVSYVLSDFEQQEWKVVNQRIPTAVEAIQCFISQGIDVAMNKFNQKWVNVEV